MAPAAIPLGLPLRGLPATLQRPAPRALRAPCRIRGAARGRRREQSPRSRPAAQRSAAEELGAGSSSLLLAILARCWHGGDLALCCRIRIRTQLRGGPGEAPRAAWAPSTRLERAAENLQRGLSLPQRQERHVDIHARRKCFLSAAFCAQISGCLVRVEANRSLETAPYLRNCTNNSPDPDQGRGCRPRALCFKVKKQLSEHCLILTLKH